MEVNGTGKRSSLLRYGNSYIAQAPGAGTIVSEIWKWKQDPSLVAMAMEQHAFKNVNNCLNANIYSFLDTSGGNSFNL